MSVGVTIVELALSEFCRDLSADASFEDRLRRAQCLLVTQLPKIPRHIRKALCLLLGVESDDSEGKVGITLLYIHFLDLQRYCLSQSLLNFFSLPFPVVPAHNLLSLYHASDHSLHTALINDDGRVDLRSIGLMRPFRAKGPRILCTKNRCCMERGRVY